VGHHHQRVLSQGHAARPDTPAPVTRLTPHFHGITIQNLTASGIVNAGAIAGLPEALVQDVILRNVNISAQRGLVVSNAQVTRQNLAVHAEEGQPITTLAGAKISPQ
jgi:hypothetical protein